MKLKSILTTLTTICMVSLSVISVNAENKTIMFKPYGQQSVSGVTVAPFSVGSNSISVNLEPYGYVYGSIKHGDGKIDEIKTELKEVKIPCVTAHNGCTERKWNVSGNRANGGGDYKIQLKSPLKEGDMVTLTFHDDGNMYFGQLVFEDKNTQYERLRKENEAEQKLKEEKYAKDLFTQSIEKEYSKTWKDRINDTFQDAWYNFKGWLYGTAY